MRFIRLLTAFRVFHCDLQVGNDREMRTLAAGFAIGLILLGGSDLESRNTLQLTVQLM